MNKKEELDLIRIFPNKNIYIYKENNKNQFLIYYINTQKIEFVEHDNIENKLKELKRKKKITNKELKKIKEKIRRIEILLSYLERLEN